MRRAACCQDSGETIASAACVPLARRLGGTVTVSVGTRWPARVSALERQGGSSEKGRGPRDGPEGSGGGDGAGSNSRARFEVWPAQEGVTEDGRARGSRQDRSSAAAAEATGCARRVGSRGKR